MLIACPECERRVSDRAAACPECAFPVRDWLQEEAEKGAREAARKARTLVGEADCGACRARGFMTFEVRNALGESESSFSWCEACRHSGRVHQCRDTRGYYAVSHEALDAFLAGTIDEDAEGITALGDEPASGHRYETAGEVYEGEGDGVVEIVNGKSTQGEGGGEGDETAGTVGSE